MRVQLDNIERILNRMDERFLVMLWTFRFLAVTAAALLCGILLRI